LLPELTQDVSSHIDKESLVKRLNFASMVWILCLAASSPAGAAVSYVINVSVDGGGSSYIQNLVNANQLPNFKRLETEGMWTLNARNDYDYTITLPTHTSMVTSRRITTTAGHGWTSNSDPALGVTIHSNKGSYVASVFDVAHDNGLRTGVYATKSKFSLFQTSYDASHGALDATGVDNGRNKIDSFVYNSSSTNILGSFVSMMTSNPLNYSLVHFTDPDTAGHANTWGSTAYNNSLIAVDGYLGTLFNMINNNAVLKDKTILVVTADHGGNGTDHSNAADPLNYTIPMFVWGPGVAPGDLYAYNLNPKTRQDPGTSRPVYSDTAIPPIRNSELGNLSLDLLGLGPIPGSAMDKDQNLSILALDGDANLDHFVDVIDLGFLATNYGMASGGKWNQGDFNKDGAIDVIDLGFLATNYGHSLFGADNVVPEPATLILLAFGTAEMLRRRK
jgi:hypothetical protein